MDRDLEAIPAETGEGPSPDVVSRRFRGRSRRWTAGLVVVAAAGLAGVWHWRNGSGGEADHRSGSSEIVCPADGGLVSNRLAFLQAPGRPDPEAALADVLNVLPDGVRRYRYVREQEGAGGVGFLGTTRSGLAKARISVRQTEGGWVPAGIAACLADNPPGVVRYPDARTVEPLAATSGLIAVSQADTDRGGFSGLVLLDESGAIRWTLPPVGAWEAEPVSWSPGGTRLVLRAWSDQQAVTRVVMYPEGRDVAVPGALTWLDEDHLLLWSDGHLAALDVASGATVEGPAQTEYVSTQTGGGGRAALVVIPGGRPGSTGASQPLLRVVDRGLHVRDAPAPDGYRDCFSPTWDPDGHQLAVVCQHDSDDPTDTTAFQVDPDGGRWSPVLTPGLRPRSVRRLPDNQGLLVETAGACSIPTGVWLLAPGQAPRQILGPDNDRLAAADPNPDGSRVVAESPPCSPASTVVVAHLDGSVSQPLGPGRQALWSPAP